MDLALQTYRGRGGCQRGSGHNTGAGTQRTTLQRTAPRWSAASFPRPPPHSTATAAVRAPPGRSPDSRANRPIAQLQRASSLISQSPELPGRDSRTEGGHGSHGGGTRGNAVEGPIEWNGRVGWRIGRALFAQSSRLRTSPVRVAGRDVSSSRDPPSGSRGEGARLTLAVKALTSRASLKRSCSSVAERRSYGFFKRAVGPQFNPGQGRAGQDQGEHRTGSAERSVSQSVNTQSAQR